MPEKKAVVESQFLTLEENGEPFTFASGEQLPEVVIAYETYGNLSPSRDNAVLIFHAFSASQHAAGYNPQVPGVGALWTEECRTGWWDGFVGPGKALDTSRYFVICANYLGGCYGSSGPASVNPETNKPYGSAFPSVSHLDIIDSHTRLLDHLGIEVLQAVLGSSLGGMLALGFASRYPKRAKKVIPISCSTGLTVLQRIHNLEQVYAIENDPHFQGGDYYHSEPPRDGTALARMIAHKTFVSLNVLEGRAKEEVCSAGGQFVHYQMSHPVESYMLHQGKKFVDRFDANSYLRILDFWQKFDLLSDSGCSSLEELFARCRDQQFLVFSIDSDVCFYPEEQRALVGTLKRSCAPVKHITVHSDKGHDSFLLEPELFGPYLSYMLSDQLC